MDKQETQFRIGGVYRNLGGEICLIDSEDEEGAILRRFGDAEIRLACRWRLSDGACIEAERIGRYTNLHLVPGELVNVNGEWLPAPRPVISAAIEQIEEHTFPKTLADRLSAHRKQTEPKRPPLPGYGQRTEFDPFGPAYKVTRGHINELNGPTERAKPFAGLQLDGPPESFLAPVAVGG